MYKVTFTVNDPKVTEPQTGPTGDMIRGQLLEVLNADFPEAADTMTVVEVIKHKEG